MEALPLFHVLRGRPVLVKGEGEAAEAKRRLIREAGGLPTDDEGAGARLAFLAMADGAEAEARRLKALGFLVNVVDRPELCDFTVPAIVDRSPVTLAIGTAGASASLAKALRERLEWLLPPALGRLAEAIRAARAEVAAVHPTVPARRAFWARLLAPGAMLDPLRPHPDAEAAIRAALAGGSTEAGAQVSDIHVPPQGAEGLTLAQLRLLASADWLWVDPALPPAHARDVLALARRDAARIAAVPATEVPPAGRGVRLLPPG